MTGRVRRARRATLPLVAGLVLALLPGPARADDPPYHVPIEPQRFTFSPGAGAAAGSWTLLWSTGAASTYITTTSAVHQVYFQVDPRPCEGSPHLEVATDGSTVFSQEMLGGAGGYHDLGSHYALPLDWQPGRHKLTFRFLDDHRTPTCDRDLRIRAVQLSSRRELGTQQNLSPLGITVSPVTAGAVGAPYRPSEWLAKLWNNGTLSFRLDSQHGRALNIAVTAARCAGWSAHVRVVLDGEVVQDGQLLRQRVINGVNYGNFELDREFADGVHTLSITMSKDLRTPTCDRNLVIGGVWFTSSWNGWASSTAAPAPRTTAR